jgi:hypothetical protein
MKQRLFSGSGYYRNVFSTQMVSDIRDFGPGILEAD